MKILLTTISACMFCHAGITTNTSCFNQIRVFGQASCEIAAKAKARADATIDPTSFSVWAQTEITPDNDPNLPSVDNTDADAAVDLDLQFSTGGPLRMGLIDVELSVYGSFGHNNPARMELAVGEYWHASNSLATVEYATYYGVPFLLGQSFRLWARAFSGSYYDGSIYVNNSLASGVARFQVYEMDGTPVAVLDDSTNGLHAPEPSTFVLLFLGAGLMFAAKRRLG